MLPVVSCFLVLDEDELLVPVWLRVAERVCDDDGAKLAAIGAAPEDGVADDPNRSEKL